MTWLRPPPATLPAAPPETRTISVLGMRLRYLDVGPTGTPANAAEDAEPLVILPGHTARIEGFAELLPALAEHHRVVVFDYPGSGYSEKPERDYTLRFYEDVTVAMLDALGIGRAVLLGGSLGGNLVLRLGHRYPERFPRLVAWGPAGAWKANRLVARIMRRAPRRLLFWPIAFGQSRFWYSRDFPGRRAALDETFAYYREVMGPGFLAMYFGMAADQLAHSHFDHAQEIRQPTLLLVGEHDNGAGMRQGVVRLHELLPANELRIFSGARHSLETEQPGKLAAEILDFLERSAAPGADRACRPVPLVAVIAAMRVELLPLVRALGLRRIRMASTGAEAYRGSTGTVDVVAAVTCMGTEAARTVTEAVLDEHPVDHVIVTGIAGAVDPALRIGTLIVPDRVVVASTGASVAPVAIDGSRPAGVILTSDSLLYGDAVVAGLRADGITAVDMETGVVGEVCERAGVPWSAFRSISDRVDDVEADYEVFALVRPDGTPDLRKVVPFLVRHPGNIPYLARLAKGSQRAVRIATRATLRAIRTHEFGSRQVT